LLTGASVFRQVKLPQVEMLLRWHVTTKIKWFPHFYTIEVYWQIAWCGAWMHRHFSFCSAKIPGMEILFTTKELFNNEKQL
jgi:hypothetical protein